MSPGMMSPATKKTARLRRAAALLVPLAAAACSGSVGGRAERTRPDPQVAAACRSRAEDVYNQQNRADLSRRDERDTPFSGSRNSGITSAGLGQLYARDRMIASCVATSGRPSSDASTGAVFGGPNNISGASPGAVAPSAP